LGKSNLDGSDTEVQKTEKHTGAIIGGIVAAALAILYLRGKVTAAQITLEDLAINPDVVAPGEEVTISVIAINTSDKILTTTIELGGDFTMQIQVTLNPGESKVVSFQVTPVLEQTYGVTIDGLSGSFICTTGLAPDIRLSNLVITPASCHVGDTVTISVTAKNYGTAAGTKTITCTVT
jgi:hypothetical protein